MRVLLVGAGGVGTAIARTASRWNLFEAVVVADYDATRAERAIAGAGSRFSAVRLDAGDEAAISQLLKAARCDVLLNAVDPRFVMPLFRAALASQVTYLDMAMSLSHPHPDQPYSTPGVKLGDEQFALAADWENKGILALVGMGVEPGLADVFARYAADHLFSSIDEMGVRDGANLVVAGYEFAPTFSIWTTIEECLNPPIVFERGKGWHTTPPFSEPEVFNFPEGIGPVECVNVEHEEVLLMPRWIDCGRVTFKYGLGDEFIGVLRTLHKLGLDSTEPVRVRRVSCLPARCRCGMPARSGRPRRSDVGPDVRRHLGARHRQGRQSQGGVPPPRRGQRMVHGGVRVTGGRVADGGESSGRTRTARVQGVVGCRCSRSRGLSGRSLPRRAEGARLAVGLRGASRTESLTSRSQRCHPPGA